MRQEYEAVLYDLSEKIRDEVDAWGDYEQAKMILATEELRCEARIITEAGGDTKKLGGNETDRKRTLELAKVNDKVVQVAYDNMVNARQVYMIAQGAKACAEYRIKLAIAEETNMR